MFRPVEVFIGSRYLRSRNRNRFASFISLISVVGIAVSVAILIVVLSVMNGFEYEIRNRILSVLSHGSITGMDGRLQDWEILSGIAADNPSVEASAPYVSGQAMLVGVAGVAGIEMRGIDPAKEQQTSGAAALLVDGSLDSLVSRGWRIVLGSALAERLGVATGDTVVLISPEGGVTPAGILPRMRRFTVSGVFTAGMYEYDRSLAYVHLDDAARLLRLGDAVTGISLSVTEPLAAAGTVRTVARDFGGGVYISDWTRQHANFFRSLQLTKSIIFFILLLVVAVAAFNIVSTLVMVVRDKRAEIAILRSMGASPWTVLGVFVTQGVLIGAIGTLVGISAGVLLALNITPIVSAIESLLQIQFVSADVYFISELPSRLMWQDVLQVGGVTFLLVVIATVYPALRGAATNPAQALRHD
ncbi:MAG: lipoprotein-releasing ABC transporter permease subunit [Gammaproteobacteria bacterium]|nr:lipoprotein-releasing ABC transporter permease subunit [Gammaproteobacteria bacterium]